MKMTVKRFDSPDGSRIFSKGKFELSPRAVRRWEGLAMRRAGSGPSTSALRSAKRAARSSTSAWWYRDVP